MDGLAANGTIAAIERDTTYARKFVRTPKMLRNDFESLSAISKPTTSEFPKDIAALWQQKLADSGLSSIYSDLSYTEIVRRIKSGELIDEMENDSYTTTELPEVHVDTIDAIDLDGFRQRPRKRQFEFGQCNLIYGVNGAGKTSLLEGIEAWMCGRHRRNLDIPIPPKCLKVKLNGSTVWLPGPVADVSIYRQRDHAWYGNYQARKNDLYANFARFSYFDADAAARLEITEDAREIEYALSHLVLGETATKIAEHIKKILLMLQKEERETSRTIRDAQETMKAAQDTNASLRVPTETRRRAYEKLTEQLQAAGWRAEPPQDSADGCLLLLTTINGLKARMDSILADLSWIGSPSIDNNEKERQALIKCTTGIQAIRHEIADLKKQQVESTRNVDVFAKWEELLQRCLDYVQAGAMGLLGSVGEQARVENRKKSLTAAAKALANIDITQFEGVTETGGDMAIRIRHDLNQHSDNTAKARQTVAYLESVHGRIKALLTEIRARVQDLLSADPETAVCPVCGAIYEKGELQNRLQHQVTHIDAPELQQAHAELAKLQKQQERMNRALSDLDTLLSIGRDAIGLPTPATEPVSKLISSIIFLERGIAQCDIDIAKLENNRGQLQEKGFNVEELQYLNRELSRLSSDLSMGDEDQLRRQIEEVKSKQKMAVEQKDGGAKALSAAEEKTHALLTQYATAGDITVETVTTRMIKISRIIEQLGEITEALTIDTVQPFTKVVVNLDALREAIEGVIRLKQQEESVVQVINENEKKIKVSKDTIKCEEPVYERLRSAVAMLEGLQSEHSAEKYLKDFFSENLKQISDLFCAMHAPHDFCNVVWQPDDPMAIRVIRKITSAACSVAEMSSGRETRWLLQSS